MSATRRRPTVLFFSLLVAAATLPAAPTAASSGLSLAVDAATARHSISPLIYGVNFADTESARGLGLTVDRWGGNSTSRYNYQTGFHNTGSDWYFENIPPAGGALPHIAFINGDRRADMTSILTVPLIGWTPKAGSNADHPYACGFRVGRYGAQDSTDPWDPNCGNGIDGGKDVKGNHATDTSTTIGPGWDRAWVQQLVKRYGNAAHGGVGIYELDNEPSLWDSTHRDVHPKPTTYAELLSRTIDYARAVKAADPTAAILGPGDWGWCAYFFSAADPGGCSDGSDRRAHGDTPFAPWYLKQLAAYQKAHGVRLLDYFDEHFYPQNGVALRDAGDAATQALRLRSTRSLWDPTYPDESWISDLAPGGIAVRFIPRMRDWIKADYPGTKPSISEYSFGGLESVNGALAEADVLGIFGRENLALATLWGAGTPTQPWAFAFRMFRNYDGAHHAFGATSVSALSHDPSQPNRPNGGQDSLSVYAAVRSSDGALTVMVINKTNAALTAPLAITGFAAGSQAQVWRYSGADTAHIVQAPSAGVDGGSVTATYPANSITLLVVPAA
jgi:Glycoside hydrolase family 44